MKKRRVQNEKMRIPNFWYTTVLQLNMEMHFI